MQGKAGRNGKLSEAEKKSLLKIATEISAGNKIVGVATYGSRVAGYASEDSDYDIIVVLDGYNPRVKYRYITGEVDASALIVDKDDLLRDADKAYLGEFVAGRLLNIYEPLIGEDFFNEVEYKIKHRVIVEALYEIEASLGEFAQEIIIPVEYFLFDKLKKRATIYPPVLYSYSKTYGEDLGKENTEASCNGFLEALKELEDEGLITLDGGEVRIKDIVSKHWMTKLSGMANYTRRGLTQYAVHGYAGRVGLNIVSREVISKISRARKGFEVPELIRKPKNLWRLDEGLLIVGEDDWFGRFRDHLNLRQDAETTKDNRGEIYSVSKIYSVSDKEREVRFAVKKFADLKAVKWVVLNIWALLSKRFDMGPISRLYREYSALKRLRELGLNTPKVLAVALDQRILVTEYIDGADMGQILSKILGGEKEMLKSVGLYGLELGKVHRSGYTLGDTKPSNAVFSKGKIYLVDLEQAARNDDRGWDLAEFIYYSSKLTLDGKAAVRLVGEFLGGYLKYGDKDSVKESLKLKYLAPFQPILAPNVVRVVRREVKERSG
ncbi:MAG: lipopolysaccharide kinase InaA family protein [Nitrososphaerales archaeon]